ncbi:hypothetical protein D039_1716B, partial [Vibrio parahaemolyticus EKP-028]
VIDPGYVVMHQIYKHLTMLTG